MEGDDIKESYPIEEYSVLALLRSEVTQSLKRVFSERRDYWVHSIMKELEENLDYAQPGSASEVEEEWQPVESLSRLRALVGGRFQNLKARWLDAGFPLREHRGDKDDEYQLDEAGWLALTRWVAKQGYEARLAPEKEGVVFELRKI